MTTIDRDELLDAVKALNVVTQQIHTIVDMLLEKAGAPVVVDPDQTVFAEFEEISPPPLPVAHRVSA